MKEIDINHIHKSLGEASTYNKNKTDTRNLFSIHFEDIF